jgi:hypothetical protein
LSLYGWKTYKTWSSYISIDTNMDINVYIQIYKI